MSTLGASDDQLREVAAEWVVLLNDTTSVTSASDTHAREDRHARFVLWLQRSEHHVAAFLRAEDTFDSLAGIDPHRRINIEQLLDRARLRSAIVQDQSMMQPVELPCAASQSVPRLIGARRVPIIAAAASILLVMGLAIFWETLEHLHVYATGTGEQRTVRLSDGSVMTLNTQSRARVEFSRGERRIQLESGEALFAVAYDIQRPFFVETPAAIIRAVGTQFDVYKHDKLTTVTVVEGVVQVTAHHDNATDLSTAATPATPQSRPDAVEHESTPRRLAAGEQASVALGKISKPSSADVPGVLAWRERLLVFRGKPLADVVSEYHRYNSIQIRIADADVGQRLMSGTFSADQPQMLAMYLQRDPSLTVTTQGNTWTIRRR